MTPVLRATDRFSRVPDKRSLVRETEKTGGEYEVISATMVRVSDQRQPRCSDVSATERSRNLTQIQSTDVASSLIRCFTDLPSAYEVPTATMDAWVSSYFALYLLSRLLLPDEKNAPSLAARLSNGSIACLVPKFRSSTSPG